MKKKNEKHYESHCEFIRRHMKEAADCFDRSFKMIGRTSAQHCKVGAANHLLTAYEAMIKSAQDEGGGASLRTGAITNEPARFRIWHEYDDDGKPLARPHFGEWRVEAPKKAAK